MNPGVVALSLPSRFDSLEEVTELIAQTGRRFEISEEDETDLLMSVVGAMNNAILQGNGQDPAKKIHLRVETTGNKVTVAIQDEGSGFDPNRVPDPTQPENLLRVSGRGILMMKSFMDTVEFGRGDRGLRVLMTKHLGKARK